MKKIIMIIMVFSFSLLHAGRYVMSKVAIKNNSWNYVITIPTHQGNITIRPNATSTIEIQRGQSYEITASAANTKNAAPLGSISTQFTSGNYEVKVESDVDSPNPDAIKISVTKPGTGSVSKKSSRYYSSDYSSDYY